MSDITPNQATPSEPLCAPSEADRLDQVKRCLATAASDLRACEGLLAGMRQTILDCGRQRGAVWTAESANGLTILQESLSFLQSFHTALGYLADAVDTPDGIDALCDASTRLGVEAGLLLLLVGDSGENL